MFCQVLFGVLVEGNLTLLGQSVAFAPLVSFGSAENLEDLIDLVKFAGAREERRLQVQLGHDTACSEDVRVEVVMVAAEDALGRPVPPGGHVRGVWARLNGQILASSKVNNLGAKRILIDHNVIRLQVPMKYAQVLVEILHAQQDLFHEYANLIVLIESNA